MVGTVLLADGEGDAGGAIDVVDSYDDGHRIAEGRGGGDAGVDLDQSLNQPWHVDYAGVTMLILLGVATSILAYVLVAGTSND